MPRCVLCYCGLHRTPLCDCHTATPFTSFLMPVFRAGAAAACFIVLAAGCEDGAGGLAARDGSVPRDGAPNPVDAEGGMHDAREPRPRLRVRCSGHGICVDAVCSEAQRATHWKG